jgi:hypothetical protein
VGVSANAAEKRERRARAGNAFHLHGPRARKERKYSLGFNQNPQTIEGKLLKEVNDEMRKRSVAESILNPAALAFVPFGIVLVRVRVRIQGEGAGIRLTEER